MQHKVIPLKTVGVLGGMSTESTKEYYRLINEGVNTILGDHNGAELLICSVNFQNIERFVRNGQWEDAGDYLARKAHQLELAGANFLLLGTNTMHKVRDRIKAAISIPFIDIFETTAQAINERGLKSVGLLGTYPVMTDEFYRRAYEAFGISIIVPSEAECREVDRVIFDELCHHQFLPQSREFYCRVADDLRQRGAEGLISGCTEIEMLLGQSDLPGMPVFDTTTLHCERAVKLCVGSQTIVHAETALIGAFG